MLFILYMRIFFLALHYQFKNTIAKWYGWKVVSASESSF
jgi:hypothetical protein